MTYGPSLEPFWVYASPALCYECKDETLVSEADYENGICRPCAGEKCIWEGCENPCMMVDQYDLPHCAEHEKEK